MADILFSILFLVVSARLNGLSSVGNMLVLPSKARQDQSMREHEGGRH